ncbi:MAG TPA: lysylphosphatidylglycerol synthase domain-containing protein [Vicinamibacterales bacterium]|nr:lysylphosphatidylglycerol synthase domain-containing protein [Vicinamibacterales bacterium]
MTRSVPQLISLVAVAIGALLFLVSLRYINLEDTLEDVSRLGLAFPLFLVPGICWHLLRTWGWSVAFPDNARPSFSRLFRVRLAADAVSFFTVRGITGDPLKVVLLYDRATPAVTAAAVALERMAFAIIAVAMSGVISYFAVRRLAMPGGWDAVFTLLSIGAVLSLGLLVFVARRRTGDYLGRLVTKLDKLIGRPLESSRVIRFILDVEDVLLELLRGDRRRLVILTILPVVCYLVMALEVWLVLWAVGEPITIVGALAIETFARLGSVASAAIPANIGALEASNFAPVAMLGLGGGGALALTRRVRAMLWAALGLILYPRLESQPPTPNPR